MTWQQQIKDLIVTKGDLKKALALFAARPEVKDDNQQQNLLTNLHAQVSGYLNQTKAGIISDSQANLLRNRLTYNILRVLEDYPEKEGDQIEDTANSNTPSPSPVTNDTPNLLFLSSNPGETGKLQLEKEFALIINKQQDSRFRFGVYSDFATTHSGLVSGLMKYQPTYLHFAGHGQGATDFHREGLLLQDSRGATEVFPAVTLAAVLSGLKAILPLKAVLLNACATEEHARKIAEMGITAIGMRGDIPDEDALTFASYYYLTLSQSKNVEVAFSVAREMVQIKRPGEAAIPQLFQGI